MRSRGPDRARVRRRCIHSEHNKRGTFLMTAFDQLRQLILDAEQRIKRKTLQQEFEKAKHAYEAARSEFETVQENLKQSRLQHGNFEQVYDQKSKELVTLREAAVRLKDELVEETALESLFKQAVVEIEEQC